MDDMGIGGKGVDERETSMGQPFAHNIRMGSPKGGGKGV